MFNLAAFFLVSALICYFISLPVIWGLKVLRVGQFVRAEGPEEHKSKAGTPTMGGIAIILAIIFFSLIMINVEIELEYAALLVLFLGYAVLGFLDDLLKLKRRANKGLTAAQKIIGQVVLASAFSAVLVFLGYPERMGDVFRQLHLNNPIFFFPFSVLVIISASNAVNLTDGLDGLAAGTLAIAFASLAYVAMVMRLNDEPTIAIAAAGASFAFLRFNLHPAEVFMGDVGALSMGALLGGLAVLMHKELLLIVIGGVFVIETLSVMLQVASFKLFGRRVFRMSPLHHHFELSGVPEPLIVMMFFIAGLVFSAIGIFFHGVL